MKLNEIEKKILEIIEVEDINGLQLSKRIGITHQTTYKYLLRLEALGLIEKEDLGNRHVYSTVVDNDNTA